MDLNPLLLAALFGAGLAAGLIDSIAGGGGMISLPALLAAGLPPHLALGTNKLQSSFGSFAATLNYGRRGLIDWRISLPGVAATALGAALGTLTVQALPVRWLQLVLPFLLAAVFLYVLLSPRLGDEDRPTRFRPVGFLLVVGFALGFYDGFFGPGTGTFWAFALVLGLGQHLVRATAHTKLMNFTSNLVSLAFFAAHGAVLLLPGLVMGAGQLAGAWLGSHLVLRRGAPFVRALFLVVVALTILRVLWATFRA